MASTETVNILEVCKVTPSLDAPESAAELCLPLTFFDTFWFKFHPVERIFFYKLSELTPEVFNTAILPKLKHSLSLTLLRFIPLAGNLVWPFNASKPFVFYTPGDGVALIVAESGEDFTRLSGDRFHEAGGSNRYVPKLSVTDSAASVVELQITYFPKQGFCIGVTSHHGILDGKSSIMFLKAWARICKRREEEEEEHPSLPPELTPCLDRSIVQDPDDIAAVHLNDWSKVVRKWIGSDSNPKSVKLLPVPSGDAMDKVKATLELSREDIRRIREKVILDLDKFSDDDPNQTKPPHLSSFVIAYACTLVCIIRAKQPPCNKRVIIGLTADCRARLDPPLPSNYFGNCVVPLYIETQAEKITREGGLCFVAKGLSKIITKLEKGVLDGVKDMVSLFSEDLDNIEAVAVAGSTRLEVYGTDFGWGRPNRVEIPSINHNGSISVAESKDANGGIEIGLVLKKHQMDTFRSLFAGGLLN